MTSSTRPFYTPKRARGLNRRPPAAYSSEGLESIFPVMADPAQWPPVLTSGHESYPIIGFVSLSVMGAWRGREARDRCEFEANNASVFCIQLRHDEVVIVPGIPGSGAYYDQTQAIRLVE